MQFLYVGITSWGNHFILPMNERAINCIVTFKEKRNAVKMFVCIACCLDDLACRIHSAK